MTAPAGAPPGDSQPTSRPPDSQPPSAARKAPPQPSREAPDSGLTVLSVEYDEDKVPTIYTKIRFATAIVFPDPEKIVEVVCGDKDWWQIYGPDRIVYVKPSKAGISTNVTIIGASGNIYSFFLQEITRESAPPYPTIDRNAPSDTPPTPYAKVVVHLRTSLAQRLADDGPKYIAKADADALLGAADQRARAANEETARMQKATQRVIEQEVTRIRTNYPAGLNFQYRIALGTKPFFVRAMFADDKFTYIKLDAQEAPAIYELKDGQPTLAPYDYVNGVFIIRRILDQGYLTIGKAKLSFSRATPTATKAKGN
jgi:type IV secretion system protein VirB9